MDDTPEVFVPSTKEPTSEDKLLDKIKSMTTAMKEISDEVAGSHFDVGDRLDSVTVTSTATGEKKAIFAHDDPEAVEVFETEEEIKSVAVPAWWAPLTSEEIAQMLRLSGLRVRYGENITPFHDLINDKIKKHENLRLYQTRILRRLSSRNSYRFDTPATRPGRRDKMFEYASCKQSEMTHFYADAGRNQLAFGRIKSKKSGLFGFLPDASVLPLIVRDIENHKKVAQAEKVAFATEASTDKTELIRYMWSLYSGAYFNGSVPADVDMTALEKTRTRDASWNNIFLLKEEEALDVNGLEIELFTGRYQDTVGTVKYSYIEGSNETLSKDDTVESESIISTGASSTNRFVRPNGEYYIARPITVPGSKKKISDVDMIRKACTNRINVLLKGRPGTGKTALTEAALENLQVVECDASTESADFLGSYVPTGVDSFEWRDGPLIVAAKNGWPLLVDEIALCDTRELAVLYSAMDGRKKIVVTSNPEIGEVDIADGFYVIGACNPDVPGAVLSDALLSRFPIQLEVTTDYGMLKSLGVDDDIITVARNLAKQEASKEIMRAPQTRELLDFMRVKSIFGLHAAVASFVASADSIDMDTYIAVVSAAFGIKAAPIKI